MGQKGHKSRGGRGKSGRQEFSNGGKWVRAGVWLVTTKMLHAMWLCLFFIATIFKNDMLAHDQNIMRLCLNLYIHRITITW